MLTLCNECRACGGDMRDVLDLGEIHPSNFVSDDMKPVGPFPMVLAECGDCGLVQMRHTLDLDMSYRQYWYTSSLNPTMVRALADVYSDVCRTQHVREGAVVIDIGCNDGTLLDMYPGGIRRIGFDPALNLADRARAVCHDFVNDYFSLEAVPIDVVGTVAVVTSIAMFYDLPDPNKFIRDVRDVMRLDGLWVIQMMDLKSMVETGAFDNICFEHLEYYSLRTLCGTLAKHGMQVVDVSYNDVNGGSLRAHVRRTEFSKQSPRVAEALEAEAAVLPDMADFGRRVKDTCAEVARLVRSVKGSVHVLGASTKGNTLLQVCGLNAGDIDFAAEVNPDKFGLRTVATDIPIIAETVSMAMRPAAYVVLPWHFKEFIVNKHADYLKAGGKFIFPLPVPHVVSGA